MPTTDFARAVETTMGSIEDNDEIHPDNKQAIQDFKRDLQLEGLSDGWLQKLTSHLKKIAEHIEDTRFEDMDKDDVKDLVEWVQTRKKNNGEPLSDATVNAYKQVIKRFWRWLYDTPKGEHPEMVAWINTTPSNGGNGKLPKDLLTRQDIELLKDACRNTRDRAFIAMLYETGARIGELIDLTVGDIEDHDNGRKVVIDGKTGQRRLPLLESTPAINKWLNDHPDPQNDAPLWCQLRDGSKELSYHYIRQKLLVRAGKRVAKENPEEYADNPGAVDDDEEELEFYKPLNPHHFRHSRATHLAAKDEFNEYKMCQWFGWTTSSDVPSKYVHLSGADIDDAYGRMHGIKTKEDNEQEETIQECPRCDELNEADASFCMRCGQALGVEAAEQIERVEEKATGDVDERDLELALKVVQAMKEDPDRVEDFLEQ